MSVKKFADIFEISLNFLETDFQISKKINSSKSKSLKVFNFYFKCIQKLKELNIPLRLLKYITNVNLKINYNIVNSEVISKLNLLYYKKEFKPTDILTFPYADIQTNLLGEIFINHIMAVKKAEQRHELLDVYCCRLIAHGLLHLLLGPHSLFFDSIEEEILSQMENNLK